MSDRAMEMAMRLFQRDAEFRNRVRNSDDKGATVSRILSDYSRALPDEKFAGAADEGLTPEEQATINSMPWGEQSDDQLLSRIGTTGCTYT
jgi:hypothetical protein